MGSDGCGCGSVNVGVGSEYEGQHECVSKCDPRPVSALGEVAVAISHVQQTTPDSFTPWPLHLARTTHLTRGLMSSLQTHATPMTWDIK